MKHNYHIDTCSLTNDECSGNDCDSCHVSIEHRQESLTTFDRTAKFLGLELKANRANTIAILNSEDELKIVLEKGKGISSTLREYSDDAWRTTHPAFAKFKESSGLGEPKEIIADKDKLGIVKYPDIIYLVAPLLKMDD